MSDESIFPTFDVRTPLPADTSAPIGYARVRVELQVLQVPERLGVEHGLRLRDLLELPAAIRVDEVRLAGPTMIELWLAAPGLPGLDCSEPPLVQIQCEVEYRHGPAGTDRRVRAWLDCIPADRWLVYDWHPWNPQLDARFGGLRG